jgi:hypothetical protein
MNVATLTGRTRLTTSLLLSLLAVSPASADTLTVAWDANSSQVTGYVVYMGTQSGNLTQRYDVGNVLAFTNQNATPGQLYCFQVSAYIVATEEGPRSNQVCGYSNQYPTLTNPGNQSSATGQEVSLQLVASDPDGRPVTYSATGLPGGLTLGANTGFIGGAATSAGTYTVTARASDGVLQSAAQTFTWSVTAAPVADTTPPSVSITGPTSNPNYDALSSTLGVSGTATDSVGVTAVSWTNDRGGSGSATGTTNWSVASIALQSGTNVITIRANDAAGNQGTDVLTVTYTPADSIAPAVTISTPTTQPTLAASSSSMTIGGTASDNVGVTQVTWVNDRGGSGTASGTTSWSVSGITLQTGTNVLTVRARDAAGNQGTDVLTVTYDTSSGTSGTGDTTAPTITIYGPVESSTYTTTSPVVTLGGISSDNVGVTAVTWTNSRGGAGFSSGTTSWFVPTVSLQVGPNMITVTAQDAANNKGTDVLKITYSPPSTLSPQIVLSGSSYSSGGWLRVNLAWTIVPGRSVVVYRNGSRVTKTDNDGSYIDSPVGAGPGPFTYQVCVSGTKMSTCSNTISVN